MSDHLILPEWVHVGDELVDTKATRLPQGPSLDVTGMLVRWYIRVVWSELRSQR
jgi:hypothetical protein